MFTRLRSRLTYANVVSTLCLFVLLGGSGYAAVKINGKDIKNRSVSGKKLKRNTLRGAEINESKLGKVPSAARADSAGSAMRADSAGRAGDARLLRGLAPSAFTRPDCASQSGAVKGYAFIQADAGFSSTFTTAGVQSAYNCSGGTVEARRESPGFYEVRFNGNGAAVAVATPDLNNLGPVTWPGFLHTSVGRVPAGGPFRVNVWYDPGTPTSGDFPFVIALM